MTMMMKIDGGVGHRTGRRIKVEHRDTGSVGPRHLLEVTGTNRGILNASSVATK